MNERKRIRNLAATLVVTSAVLIGCAPEPVLQAVDQPSTGAIAYRLPGCRVEPVAHIRLKPGSNPPVYENVTIANYIITPPPGGEIISLGLAPLQARIPNSSVYDPILGPIVTFRGPNSEIINTIAFDVSCNLVASAQFQAPATRTPAP
jgi:hypothetical protein